MMKAIGLDARKGGWVAVSLVHGSFYSAEAVTDLADFLHSNGEAAAVAIDIPIGLPDSGRRAADIEAKLYLVKRRNSVFLTPPRASIEAPKYPEAVTLCKKLAGYGLSRQSYGLRMKIMEVDKLVGNQPNLYEAHPEVSFTAMAGHPMNHAKKSWNGTAERLKALSSVGIELPFVQLGSGNAGVDDVIDAAAVAWTADRKGRGEAQTLPAEPPLQYEGRPVAIWY
ncbi:DUF429 domain-containing protein [soil metagenome]